ncbi:MAG: formylmethanofuran dehydrogenase subunit E family protein [Desulfobacterales bacterium]|nr:MAG: formylmethanofuran dehydrogenase subunit E family protein [Desulfobacterales bacterium]
MAMEQEPTENSRMICGRSVAEFLQEIEKFHGYLAPGLVLGGFMVDRALELIGPGVEADAIVETRYCLPDAVQLFTPCTYGNGWMKVVDWDKFALTLYDRHNLNGYRVWLDLTSTRSFPNLYNWYMQRVPKHDLPLEVLNQTIFEAGRSVLSSRAIRLTDLFQRSKKGPIAVCPRCGEAYPTRQGDRCRACQGNGYYAPR